MSEFRRRLLMAMKDMVNTVTAWFHGDGWVHGDGWFYGDNN